MSLRRAWLALLALAALSLFPFCVAPGQEPTAGNCHLGARAFDNPLSDHGGWVMARWKWHVMYPALSTSTAIALHRTTRLPGWASAIAATVVIGVLPHIRGAIRGTYRVDVGDWAFDAFTRGAPALYMLGRSGRSWQATTLATTTYGLGYLVLCPYASP